MISRLASILMLAFLSAAGCGTSNHLNRDRLVGEVRPESEIIGLRSYRSAGGAFDGQLKLLYEKKIKGSASSPLVTALDLVAFRSTRQRFIGFDPATGKKILQIKKRRGFVLNPLIDDTLLVLVERSGYGTIKVRNLFTGKVIEERLIKEIRSGPIIVSGRLVFGTSEGLLALDLPGLETAWRGPDKENVILPATADTASIYYTADNGLIRAVAAGDGKEQWKNECGAAVASELSVGRYLYAGLADGRLIAVDKENGEIVWERQFKFPVHGGVAEYDGRVYVGATDDFVYCLSAADGSPVWQFETGGIVTASPIVYGKAVLIGSHDRHFYSLDRISGQLIDRRRLDGAVKYTAAVDRGLIIVADRDNRLYCFEGY